MGGAILWNAINGNVNDSTFTSNNAIYGGAINWILDNGKITSSSFTSNTASYVNDIQFHKIATMINCNFNSKGINASGIYAHEDLIINGGTGIVDIFVNGTLSGISIIVLNNETYYYPPNSNINLIKYR